MKEIMKQLIQQVRTSFVGWLYDYVGMSVAQRR